MVTGNYTKTHVFVLLYSDLSFGCLPGTSSSSVLTTGIVFSAAGMSVLVLSAPDELLDLVSVIEPVLDLGSSLTDADLVLLLGLSGLVGGTGLESSGLGEPSG